jgi:transcriptional regulator with XRE-family HTH domain
LPVTPRLTRRPQREQGDSPYKQDLAKPKGTIYCTSPAALRNFRIDADGSFIHWPIPDVHLGWNRVLQAADPLELHKAQQRSADFNRRYGAAIRKYREEAGIPQAKVEGITERQLRRIEQGESRVTLNALRALAKAHGLDVNTSWRRWRTPCPDHADHRKLHPRSPCDGRGFPVVAECTRGTATPSSTSDNLEDESPPTYPDAGAHGTECASTTLGTVRPSSPMGLNSWRLPALAV